TPTGEWLNSQAALHGFDANTRPTKEVLNESRVGAVDRVDIEELAFPSVAPATDKAGELEPPAFRGDAYGVEEHGAPRQLEHQLLVHTFGQDNFRRGHE